MSRSSNKFVFWVVIVLFLVIQMLLIIKFPVRSQEDPVWTLVGPAGFSADSASNMALALNSSGEPYVFFADASVNNKATVMKWNGTIWELVGTAGFSSASVANALSSNSLVFDSNDVPYVAFCDLSADDKATVMKWNGISWEPVGIPGFSAGSVDYLFMAIDAQDIPYVAFRDGASDNRASVMMYDGDSWELVGAAGISDGAASFTTLDFDSSHNPYLAYKDNANGDGTTVQMYTSTDGWQVLGSEAFSPGAVNFPVIRLDNLDVPYIAFADLYYGSELTVMRYFGSDWNLVGDLAFSADISFSMPWYITMQFDSANRPYVAYAAQRIYVFYYNDSIWHELGALPLIDEYCDYSSMDIDGTDIVYVAFTDNSGKATVMSIAAVTEPTPTPTETESTQTESTPTSTEAESTVTEAEPTATEATSDDEEEEIPQTGELPVWPLIFMVLVIVTVLIAIVENKYRKQS